MHKFSFFSIREETGALLKIINVEMGEGVGEDRFSSWLRTEMGTIKSHGIISGTRTRPQNMNCMQFFCSSNCPCRMYRLKDIQCGTHSLFFSSNVGGKQMPDW